MRLRKGAVLAALIAAYASVPWAASAQTEATSAAAQPVAMGAARATTFDESAASQSAANSARPPNAASGGAAASGGSDVAKTGVTAARKTTAASGGAAASGSSDAAKAGVTAARKTNAASGGAAASNHEGTSVGRGESVKSTGVAGGAIVTVNAPAAVSASAVRLGADGSAAVVNAATTKKASPKSRTVAPGDARTAKASKTGDGATSTSASADCVNPAKGANTPLNSTHCDPELLALERAERELFPQALRGIRPTFAFDSDGDWAWSGSSGDDSRTTNRVENAWYRDLILPQIFPNVDGRILTYLEFYRSQPEGRTILRTWAKKRGKYESTIVSALTKAGVPRDLVWQSLVESAHNPTIKSPAGAVGLWQFMPETARLYGLTVDRWLDERLDPERATEAAARMMSDQYQRFGNWELALAAYNMGEAGLVRAIRKYNTNDFWTLSRYEAGLPWETALYVPRIIAITIAMNNPKAFGIDDVPPDESVALEAVVLAAGMPLSTIARAAGISEEQIAQYNPQLLAGRLPPAVGAGRTLVRVYVPRGLGESLRNRLSRLLGPEPDLEGYALKRGESLDAVASRLGVSLELLKSVNRIAEGEAIEPGTVLLVPRAAAIGGDSNGADVVRVAVVPPDVRLSGELRRVFYRVSPGDTLSRVAESFGVSRVELLETNSLDPSARLQPDMLLQILISKEFAPKNVKFLEEKECRVLVAGSNAFFDYFEEQRGNERIVVQAREKDTLASIGARHGISVGTMERINRRSRRDVLTPGEPVVVYVRRASAPERVGVAK